MQRPERHLPLEQFSHSIGFGLIRPRRNKAAPWRVGYLTLRHKYTLGFQTERESSEKWLLTEPLEVMGGASREILAAEVKLEDCCWQPFLVGNLSVMFTLSSNILSFAEIMV